MLHRPDLLLIGAAGRNSGKTTLACALIHRLSAKGDVVGIKVTTIHDASARCPRGSNGCGTCATPDEAYSIEEELLSDDCKDTRRMRNAGAKRVFWLRVRESALAQGFEALLERIPDGTPIVCESNSARRVLTPGLFVIVQRKGDESVKPSCRQVMPLANRILVFDGTEESLPVEELIRSTAE